MAVAGPELLGEGPIGSTTYFSKRDMLDAYRNMTRQVAADHDVPYIDMRQAFLDAIPKWWVFGAGWITDDGEHPNDQGSAIEASLFAKMINQWVTEWQEGL